MLNIMESFKLLFSWTTKRKYCKFDFYLIFYKTKLNIIRFVLWQLEPVTFHIFILTYRVFIFLSYLSKSKASIHSLFFFFFYKVFLYFRWLKNYKCDISDFKIIPSARFYNTVTKSYFSVSHFLSSNSFLKTKLIRIRC